MPGILPETNRFQGSQGLRTHAKFGEPQVVSDGLFYQDVVSPVTRNRYVIVCLEMGLGKYSAKLVQTYDYQSSICVEPMVPN